MKFVRLCLDDDGEERKERILGLITILEKFFGVWIDERKLR